MGRLFICIVWSYLGRERTVWMKSYYILYERKTEAAATFDVQPSYQIKAFLILSVYCKSHLYILRYPNTLNRDDALRVAEPCFFEWGIVKKEAGNCKNNRSGPIFLFSLYRDFEGSEMALFPHIWPVRKIACAVSFWLGNAYKLYFPVMK